MGAGTVDCHAYGGGEKNSRATDAPSWAVNETGQGSALASDQKTAALMRPAVFAPAANPGNCTLYMAAPEGFREPGHTVKLAGPPFK